MAFEGALNVCGLSKSEAAVLCKVSEATLEKWCDGTLQPSRQAWIAIATIFEHMFEAATDMYHHVGADGLHPQEIEMLEGTSGVVGLPNGAIGQIKSLTALLVFGNLLPESPLH